MVFGFYLFNDLFNNAFFVNDKGCSGRAHVLSAIHLFFYPGAKLFVNALVFIGNERKGQLKFIDEVLVFFGRIGTNTYHCVACLKQCFVVIAQVAGLRGTAGCIVFGVEVKSQFFSAKI